MSEPAAASVEREQKNNKTQVRDFFFLFHSLESFLTSDSSQDEMLFAKKEFPRVKIFISFAHTINISWCKISVFFTKVKRDYTGVLFNVAGVCLCATFLCVIIVKVRICRHVFVCWGIGGDTAPAWRGVGRDLWPCLTAGSADCTLLTPSGENKKKSCDRVLRTQLWSLNTRDSKVVYFSFIFPQISFLFIIPLSLSAASSRNKH